MQIVVVHPQIAPNTGNIIRIGANVGASVHLVEPLGFSMDDKLLRRGGLDYHELTDVHVHPSFEAAREAVPGRWLAFTNRGATRYDRIDYRPDDVLVFGCEATGLSEEHLATFPDADRVAIPMRPNNRSLNLGNAISVVVYEAWRQHDFDGAAGSTGTLETLVGSLDGGLAG